MSDAEIYPPRLRHPCLEKVLYLGKPQDHTFRSEEGILFPNPSSLPYSLFTIHYPLEPTPDALRA